MSFPNLFKPLAMGKLELKNRVVIPAHGPRLGRARYLTYLEERVKNDVGLLICSVPAMQSISSYNVTPPTPYDPDSSDAQMPNPAKAENARFYDELTIPFMAEEAAMAHRHGAACFGQLVNSGSYNRGENFQPGLSPSGVADEMLGEVPHALSVQEIKEMVSVYGQGARRVQQAGMDGVEIHSCHGLLLNSFLSPLTNKREDEYGGSLENRVRFLLEIFAELRRVVGSDFIVGIRMPSDEFLPRGLTSRNTVDIGLMLKPYLNYIDVSGASEHGRKGGLTIPAVMSNDFGEGIYFERAAALRAGVGLPVLLTGKITDPTYADKVLGEGKVDLIGMVRAFIADPEWAKKAKGGDAGEIRMCTGDNEGCRRRTQVRGLGGGLTLGCTQNAAVGREKEMEIVSASTPKRVVVIGGGPGGMEAARIAALRGHQVTLYEKGAELGGQVLTAARDPRQKSLFEAVRYRTGQLEKLRVEVRLRTAMDAETVQGLASDAVIVATGAVPHLPSISGADTGYVVTIGQVLDGEAAVGPRVCVVAGFNGYREPATLAEMLADQGHQVEVITERMFVGESQDPGSNHNTLRRLMEKNVGMHTLTGLKAIEGTDLLVYNSLTRQERVMQGFDSVVVAMGGVARDEVYHTLRNQGRQVIAVGDCLAPRRVLHAVLEGARAGHAV